MDGINQIINLLASLMLLLSFAMLGQRRVNTLISLYICQGLTLVLIMSIVGISTSQPHLFYSAGLNFVIKVILIPSILRRLVRKLAIKWDVEALVNIPTTLLIGIILVVLAFNLALPVTQMAGTITRSNVGIALGIVLLSSLMLITRRRAVSQVIGFLAMENGILFGATSATYGMPLIIEIGVGFDVLVGTFIFGIFFFHIREAFDSLDTRQFEHLKENQ